MSYEHLVSQMCQVCGYMYDPEKGDIDNGIQRGIPLEKLPEDFTCPWCGGTKDLFTAMGE